MKNESIAAATEAALKARKEYEEEWRKATQQVARAHVQRLQRRALKAVAVIAVITLVFWVTK
jgi:hypothetical protein